MRLSLAKLVFLRDCNLDLHPLLHHLAIGNRATCKRDVAVFAIRRGLGGEAALIGQYIRPNDAQRQRAVAVKGEI